MTIKEIKETAAAALERAGMNLAVAQSIPFPGPSGAVIACVMPEYRWHSNARCLVVVTTEAVQRWEQEYPLNSTTGRYVEEDVKYSTITEMVDAVKRMVTAPKADCWKS